MDHEPAAVQRPDTGSRERRIAKRGRGEGNIDYNAQRRRWRGRIMLGRTLDGKPDRRVVYGKTRSEVQRKLDELRRRQTAGLLGEAKAERERLADFLARWLDARQPNLRSRTHLRYAQLMNKHVVPALGHVTVGALKPEVLEQLYAAKLETGLSPRTVHHIHTVLHTALAQAVRWGYAPRNAAESATPPKVPGTEVHWLSVDEVHRLLDATQRERLHGLWATAIYTGCRLGELLGLTWEAVDLDGGVLHVRQVLVRVRNWQPIFGEPKTKRSRRRVPLTPDAVAALRAHSDRQAEERRRAGSDYAPYKLVFATQLGTPLSGTVVQVSFKRALQRAGLPRETRIHDLRHTAATLMLASGIDIPTVAAILGHSRNSTTLDIYAHAVPNNLNRAVNAIQRALRRKP